MDKIKKWEIWGAGLTIIFGSLLHFVFEWSGGSHIVALFGAVNESTWEHLKLAFWPTFIFTFIEWFVFRKEIKNFCFAAFVKLFSMPIIIVILFYSWLLFLRDNFIWDITIFIVAVMAGYYLSYKIIKNQKQRDLWPRSSVGDFNSCRSYNIFTFYLFPTEDISDS